MGIHPSHTSMIKESLPELLKVAEYCVVFRKDPKEWGSEGCYGYPANILLLAIADSVGSYVLKGDTRNHFNILNHSDYYNLNLAGPSIETIYKAYRCLGTHNAVIGKDVILDIGDDTSKVFDIQNGIAKLNLKPLLNITKTVVAKFLENADDLVPEFVDSKK